MLVLFASLFISLITLSALNTTVGDNNFCEYFSVSETNSASNDNVAICVLWACGGDTIVASACHELSTCSGDQLFKLVDSSGIVLSVNDDSCSTCSEVIYTVLLSDSTCNAYYLHQGCYADSSCAGQVYVSGATVIASPTVSPTSSEDRATPSPVAENFCDPFSTRDTDSGNNLDNNIVCNIWACPGDKVIATACDEYSECSGDQIFRLYDSRGFMVASNDDYCGLCSTMEYDVSRSTCDVYYLHQACFGDTLCSGLTRVFGATVIESPTSIPTFSEYSPYPSSFGSPSPFPTAYPSLLKQYCNSFDVQNTQSATVNSAICYIQACSGDTIIASACNVDDDSYLIFTEFCMGDQFFRLLDESGTEVASNDDTCSYCSEIEYDVPEITERACQVRFSE
jgi:hypothetical protein